MKSNVFHRLAAAALATGAAFACSGCASTYAVKVSSIHRPVPAAHEISSYRIHSKNPLVAQDSLRYKEITDHIRTALSARGLYEAPNLDSADMIVEIDCGVTEPRVKVTNYSVPVFARSGAGNYDGPLKEGRSAPPDRLAASLDSSNKELIAFNELQRRTVVCEKHMSVAARENKTSDEGRPPEEFWRIHVSIENESKDLRGHLPILASAAMDQFGTTADGVMTLSENHESVRFIKKGM